MSDAMSGGKIERFEDLVAWQRARVLTANIYPMTAAQSMASNYGLKNQIRRAAVSIMSNIAEGFERGKASEFHQFLSVAKSIMRRGSIPAVCRVRRRLFVGGRLWPIDELGARSWSNHRRTSCFRGKTKKRRNVVDRSSLMTHHS
jgi:hypothetical protein